MDIFRRVRWAGGAGVIFLACLCLGIAGFACSRAEEARGVPPETPAQQLDIQATQKTDLVNPVSTAGAEGVLDRSTDPAPEVRLEGNFLPCPPPGAQLELAFEHVFTVQVQDMALTYTLHPALLPLQVADDRGTILSSGDAQTPYTLEGTLGAGCTVAGGGSMAPSVHGSCENGLVRLVIEENWSASEGRMECVKEESGAAGLEFTLLPLGLIQYSGELSQGEIFFLVEGRAGYSVLRPYPDGEGSLTWTLYAPEFAPELRTP